MTENSAMSCAKPPENPEAQLGDLATPAAGNSDLAVLDLKAGSAGHPYGGSYDRMRIPVAGLSALGGQDGISGAFCLSLQRRIARIDRHQ